MGEPPEGVQPYPAACAQLHQHLLLTPRCSDCLLHKQCQAEAVRHSHTRCAMLAEGWNQKRRWVKLAKTIDTPRSYNGRHPGRNRVRLQSQARRSLSQWQVQHWVLPQLH